MKQYKNVIIALVVLTMSAHGAERVWTGYGDGHTFADSRNWDGAVASEDSLVIENPMADTTLYLTNDLGSADSPFKLFSITAQGEGSIRISGNPIEPTCPSDGTNIVAKCALETDFDIKIPNKTTYTPIQIYLADYTTLTLNGTITAPGSGTRLRLLTNRGTFVVNGDISIPNGTVNCRGCLGTTNMSGTDEARWYFNGKVTASSFDANTSYLVYGEAHFSHTDNEFGIFYLCNDKVYLDVAGALSSSTRISPGASSSKNIGTLYLQRFDQTIDRLVKSNSTAGKSDAGHNISGVGSTFTMACSENNTTNDFRFIDSVNAVWAPLGDYTCSFMERTHTTSGRISVKRGTMAFLGATEFQNLSVIEIAAGAKFSLAETTTATPLPKLAALAIEDGSSSVIALREGCSVTACVTVGGSPLAVGTYTGAGGTADHVVDWIEGRGVVNVITMDRFVASKEWVAAHGYVQQSDATFMTLGDPATNISDAVASAKAGGRILLLPGTHRLTDQVNVAINDLSIEAYDPVAGATVDAQGLCRHFNVTAANYVIKGLTLVNGCPEGGAGSVAVGRDASGSILDCTFCDNMATNSAYWQGLGGAIYSDSANTFISNCVFSANSVVKSNCGGAICLRYSATDTTQNRIVDCDFSSNRCNGEGGAGGAIYSWSQVMISGCRFSGSHFAETKGTGGCCSVGRNSIVENCQFAGEASAYVGACIHVGGTNVTVKGCLFSGMTLSGNGGIIYTAGDGLVADCIFTNNSFGAGCFVHQNAGNVMTVRNCLVADNDSDKYVILGHGGNLRFENCTIQHPKLDTHWDQGYSTNVFVNCIVRGTTIGVDARRYTILTNCCVTAVPGGNLDSIVSANDPKFIDAANGNYGLKRASPCRDAGLVLDWMNSETLDLAGNPRLIDAEGNVGTAAALPDLGCYESNYIRIGTVVIVW